MVRRLTSAHKASILAKLHTIGLSNEQIAAAEGITERYVRMLRIKEARFGTPWPENITPQNSTKLVPAAEKALLEHLAQNPDLAPKEQQEFLLREFGITVSAETIRRHLRQANFVKPRAAGGQQRPRRRPSDRLQELGGGAGSNHPPAHPQTQPQSAPRSRPGPSNHQNNFPEPPLAPARNLHQPQTAVPLIPGQQTTPLPPVSIHHERHLHGTLFLASNNPSLVSLPFVTSAYNDKQGGMYWTTPLDAAQTRLMVANSSIMGVYYHIPPPRHHTLQPHHHDSLQQVAMARFVTDHVTHAYLTDVYVAPEWRGKGLGTWLVKCCDEWTRRIPTLRKVMVATSNPRGNARWYQRLLGVEVPEQDWERGLIMVRKGQGVGGGESRFGTGR
ncbi:hypothetical protein GE09DRAFT_1194966 [Coniochaeta sp. 2T2.1]|nr:hypothetical protein GE09DRAFT_1194966 [Coniochaeta sp. 2T2.1]